MNWPVADANGSNFPTGRSNAMDKTDEARAQQNVSVKGDHNYVIVAAGDVVIEKHKEPRRRTVSKPIGAYAARVVAFILVSLVGAPMPNSPLSRSIAWPDGKSALCRDGTFSPSQTRSGTCSHHRGVAEWRFAADDPYWRH
jgi:hypothetical protein